MIVPARIIVYDDPQAKTSTSVLTPALRAAFPGHKIESCKTAEFMDTLKNGNASLAVIPGIYGEDCPYYDLLGGEDGQKIIQDFVRHGGLLMTICAGSYLVARETRYAPALGPEKSRLNNAALFNAVARGPVNGDGRRSDGPGSYDDTTVLTISYKNAAGGWSRTGIAYGNGPALIPDENDNLVNALAHYDDDTIAAAWKTEGQGAVLWLGVLPYMGYEKIPPHLGAEKISSFMEKLKPHETGRTDFWTLLVRRMSDHLAAALRKDLAPAPRFQDNKPS